MAKVAMRYGSGSSAGQNISVIGGGGGGGGGSLVLVWTNPNPSSSYAAGTESVDLSEYAAVLIKTLNDPSSQTPQFHSEIVFVGDTGVCYSSNASTTGYTYKRQASVSQSGVTFGGGYRNTSAGNGYAVPQEIYGISMGTPPVVDPLNTFSGSIVTFTSLKARAFKSFVGSFMCSQSYNGYSKPWAAGKGSNLCGGLDLANEIQSKISSATIDTTNKTVSYAYNASQDDNINIPSNITFKANTQYTFIFTVYNASYARSNLRVNYTNGSYSLFPDLSATNTKETIVLVSRAGYTVKSLAKHGQGGTTRIYYEESGIFEGVLTAGDFEPYENICPIVGVTESNIFDEASYDPAAIAKRTVSFGQTAYGGEYTIDEDGSVTLTQTEAEIASYNGEVLPSTWLSDRDEYAVGTTPTIGAQVVYALTTSTTSTLTPITPLYTLIGTNTVWADTGDITVTAYGT